MSNDKKMSPELLDQIQKILNPTGPLSHGPPNLKPVPGTEHEQHKKPGHEKKAFIGEQLGKLLPKGSTIGQHLANHDHAYDLAGLGMLAAPPAIGLAQSTQKDSKKSGWDKAKDVAELGGLGMIAAPVAAQAMGFKHASSALDELQKLGAVSDEEAAHALHSIQDLEDNKPSLRQTAGYASIGAITNPLMHAAGNVIKRRSPFEGLRGTDKLRDAAAQAFKGGVGGTAVSIAQQQLDRHHSMSQLRDYMTEHDAQKTAEVLTTNERKELPKKDFAVTASKSNTGDKAYPIPDKQHASSALGFAKMHGDSADYAKVRAKVEQKFPDMLKKAMTGPSLVAPKAPKLPGLAGSGTPTMPMPKIG